MTAAIRTPDLPAPQEFRDAAQAVARLIALHDAAAGFLCDAFAAAMRHGAPGHRVRAFYPEIRVTTAASPRSTAG